MGDDVLSSPVYICMLSTNSILAWTAEDCYQVYKELIFLLLNGL